MATFHVVSGAGSVDVETEPGDSVETVAAILALVQNQLNVPAGATPSVNGAAATPTTKVKDGDEIAFSKPTGAKGR